MTTKILLQGPLFNQYRKHIKSNMKDSKKVFGLRKCLVFSLNISLSIKYMFVGYDFCDIYHY